MVYCSVLPGLRPFVWFVIRGFPQVMHCTSVVRYL